MKIMVVFSYRHNDKLITENATATIKGPIPTISELAELRKRLRLFCGYYDVVILNWFEVKE